MQIVYLEASSTIDDDVKKAVGLVFKAMLLMFVVDIVAGILILYLFSEQFLSTDMCNVDSPNWWISLWPPNIAYIRALLPRFYADDVCVMLCTLSASFIVCVISIIPVIFIILFAGPTLPTFHAHRMALASTFGLAVGIAVLHMGISPWHTLRGPSIYHSIESNSESIIFMMASSFFMFAFLIFALRALVGHISIRF